MGPGNTKAGCLGVFALKLQLLLEVIKWWELELSQWVGFFLRPLSSRFSSARSRCSWSFIRQERSEWNSSQKRISKTFPNLWDLGRNISGHFPILQRASQQLNILCVCLLENRLSLIHSMASWSTFFSSSPVLGARDTKRKKSRPLPQLRWSGRWAHRRQGSKVKPKTWCEHRSEFPHSENSRGEESSHYALVSSLPPQASTIYSLILCLVTSDLLSTSGRKQSCAQNKTNFWAGPSTTGYTVHFCTLVCQIPELSLKAMGH